MLHFLLQFLSLLCTLIKLLNPLESSGMMQQSRRPGTYISSQWSEVNFGKVLGLRFAVSRETRHDCTATPQ